MALFLAEADRDHGERSTGLLSLSPFADRHDWRLSLRRRNYVCRVYVLRSGVVICRMDVGSFSLDDFSPAGFC